MKTSGNLAAIVSAVLFASSLAVSTASAEQAGGSSAPATAPPPPAGQTGADLAAWRSKYVNEAGVAPLGATKDGMEYAVMGSFAIAGPGLVRGWVRWESFAPTKINSVSTRSYRQLIEVDCQQGRGRMMAMDLYQYNNLQGAEQQADAQDPQWSYARPGTVLEQNVNFMCTAARAVVSAALTQAQAADPQPQSSSQNPSLIASR